MDPERIKELADRTGIDRAMIERWARIGAPRMTYRAARPDGCLSVMEVVRRHRIRLPVLLKWRKAGLRVLNGRGRVIWINERELLAWMEKHEQTDRPAQ